MSIKVQIKPELLSAIPFSLKTRHGIATVLGFMGDFEAVSDLMQYASHGTRAYWVNAQGLRGFVVKSGVMELLKRGIESRFQVVD